MRVVEGVAVSPEDVQYGLVQFESDAGNPGIGIVRPGLRSADFPLFDLHNELLFGYSRTVKQPSGEDTGLPIEEDGDALRQLETVLINELGDRGVFVGHFFLERTFTIHLYSDSEDQNVTDWIATWANSHKAKSVRQHRDASWIEVRDFVG